MAGKEAALWLHAVSLAPEHAGRALSRYGVEYASGTDRLAAETRPALFETSYALAQMRLFALDEAGWLKAPRLEGYAPRKAGRPTALQAVPFPSLEAL